jgi:prepilin peptidase CpaA
MMNMQFTLILLILLAVLLVAAAAIDIATRTIPNWLNVTIAVLAPVYWLAAGIDFYPDVLERIGGAYLLFVAFFGLFCLGGMGGGDVKMGGALALWFAPLATLQLFVITCIAGGFVSGAAYFYHHRIARAEGKTEVPYGVAIAIGGLWLLAQRFLNQFA